MLALFQEKTNKHGTTKKYIQLYKLRMVAQSTNPVLREIEARELGIQGHSQLLRELEASLCKVRS